jgi:type IV pilus assembly protein PilB
LARRRRLGEILLEAGLITDLQLTVGLGEQHNWGRRLGAILIDQGVLAEADLVRVLSAQLGVAAVDLEGKSIDPEVLALLPRSVVEKYACLPLFRRREGGKDQLYLGMEDPCDLDALDDVSFHTGLKVMPVVLGPRQLWKAIDRFYGGQVQDAEEAGSLLEAPIESWDTAPVLSGAEPAAPPPRAQESAAAEEEPPIELEESYVIGLEEEPEPAPEAGSEKPREVPTRTILRAVTHLLLEKGVITREELMERIQIESAKLPK